MLSLTVYPNPFNDYFQVALESVDYYDQIIIEVFDLSGRKLRSEIFDFSTQGSPIHQVDMADTPQGGYIVNVRTGTLQKTVLVTKNSR